MTDIILKKDGNVYSLSGKPFDITTFNMLKNAGLLFFKSGMHGQLYQECFCGIEPVCVSCLKCERHCTCGGKGWVLTEQGVKKAQSLGFNVIIDDVKLSPSVSVADAEKQLTERKAREKVEREAERLKKIVELEAKGIILDENKFIATRDEWTKNMEFLGWNFGERDYKLVKKLDSLEYRSEFTPREPSTLSKNEIVILDSIPTIAVNYEYYDMEGYSQSNWYAPKEIAEKVKVLLEKKQKEEKDREDKERVINEKLRKERFEKEAEERACKEAERVKKEASMIAGLSKKTKNELLSEHANLLSNGTLRKSWGKDEIVKAIAKYKSG